MENIESPAIADHPFNDKNTSDVILQTTDGVHFYVNKIILSLSSGVFSEMFTLPSPQEQSLNDVVDGKTVIHLQDGSQDLFHLLSWCDPRGSPSVDNIQHMLAAMKLANKYDMEHTLKRVERTLKSRPDLIKDNFSATYAIAVRYTFPELVQISARHSLSTRVHEIPHVNEFDFVTGTDVQKLYRYWYSCAEAVQTALHSREWAIDESDTESSWPELISFEGTCRSCSDSIVQDNRYRRSNFKMRAWLVEYINRLKTLLHETPTSDTINNTELSCYAITKMVSCAYCRELFEQGKFGIFTESLKRKIEEAIATVRSL